MERLYLEIATPERLMVAKEVDMVEAPGTAGEFGVLPGHTPFFTTLKIGEIMYRAGKNPQHIAVAWGFVEVLHDKVTILAEAAELPETIDVERAKRAKERAEKNLKQLTSEDKEYFTVVAALDRAMNRISVASRRR